jgi:hypothetical protein
VISQSYLTPPQRQWTLKLGVDERLRVTSLLSSCEAAQQNEATLLQNGYKHLFWAIVNYLFPDVRPEPDGRHWPRTTLRIHPSITIGQTGCLRAAAATKIALAPFAETPTHAFVRVAAGDCEWYGWPILGATVTTNEGTEYQVVYCKWLDHALTGIERLKLPLPSTFPLHQWAKTHMGLPPRNGYAHQPSESYGCVDASKVLNWEPISSIGLRTYRPTSAYLGATSDTAELRSRGKRVKHRHEPAKPSGVGEALFANNVHVWSFGSSES